MKSTRNNKKRILSFVLSLVMVCTVFAGIVPLKASAAEFAKIIVDTSAIELYESGCLKSIPITIQAELYDGMTAYQDAWGKIAIHNAESNFKYKPEENRYSLDGTKWPEDYSRDTSLIRFAGGDEFLWSNCNPYGRTFTFVDGEINLLVNGTYYVYLWTRAPQFGVYPDKILATLTVSNGELKFGDDVLATVPKTYNITFDRTNYPSDENSSDENVKLFTYNNGVNEAVNETSKNETVAMPVGGYVKVVADSDFAITVDPKPENVVISKEGNSYTISGITEATTISVNKIVLEADEEVEVTEQIDGATLNNKEALLSAESNIFTDGERQGIAAGADAKVWLKIKKFDDNTLSAEEKSLFEQAAEGANIVYMDISLFKSIEGILAETKIGGEVTKPISITLKLKGDLINTDTTLNREYKIIRSHEGTNGPEVEIIGRGIIPDTGELTFETKKFSTYAIAYKDVDPTPTPTPSTEPSTPPTTPPSSTPTPAPVVPTPTAKPEVAPVENPKDDVPNTGHSNVALYAFAVMAISGGSVVFLTKKKKSL